MLRLFGFSVAGLALYCILYLYGAPEPSYVFPSKLKTVQPPALPPLAAAYLGHWISSTVVGGAVGGLVLLYARLTGQSAFPCAWDIFVRSCVADHWVVVGLQNGEAYAGMLRTTDTSVQQEERDIVIAEPALYDESKQEYIALPYQHLFLRADMVASLATVHDPRMEGRIVPVGGSPFMKEAENGKSTAATAS